MKDITIRQGIPTDAEGYIAHMIAIASEPDVYVSYTPLEANMPVEKEATTIRKHLERGNFFLVAETEGRVIAQLRCVIDSSYVITHHTAVLGMSVDRTYRNQSVGAKMMEQAIKWAEDKNIVRLELEVYSENVAAIHLYEKFGFEIEGRKRMYAYQRGRYYDSYMMSRLLV
ncbi:MAG TPA: GNAT family N-acetyltransferase [Blastocatellia bacterium]|nr:GNAT family N-acetyltransferase [Blastocatellia bacterium]